MDGEQEKQEISKPERDERGRLLPGHTANPHGRPKGKSLKEFAREMLMTMNDTEKTEYLKTLPKDIVWKMAEGNPHQATDVTSGGNPIPILGNALSTNDSNEQSTQPEQTN